MWVSLITIRTFCGDVPLLLGMIGDSSSGATTD